MSPRRAALIASIGTAVASWALFGVIHAFWIVPIWNRMLGGLPFAIVGAAAVGWAYAETMTGAHARGVTMRVGFAFGAIAWALLLPATAAASVIRLAGLHQPEFALPEDVLVMSLTASVCGLVGWRRRRSPRAGAACALAGVVLLAVQSGPIPAINGFRAAGLLFLLLPLYAFAGAVQAVASTALAQPHTIGSAES